MLVLDARLVASQPLHDDSLLPHTQALGSDGAVGQENVHHGSPDAAQRADDQEFKLPTRKSTVDVTNTEA